MPHVTEGCHLFGQVGIIWHFGSCQAHTISINSTGGACTVTDRATASTIPNLSQVWRTRSSQPLHKPKCPNRKKREEENSPARKES